MIHQENEAGVGSDIEALLTAEQVAAAILQAVKDEQRDLTLAPNADIHDALLLYGSDPQKAERAMGRFALQARATRQA